VEGERTVAVRELDAARVAHLKDLRDLRARLEWLSEQLDQKSRELMTSMGRVVEPARHPERTMPVREQR
jgi:hypothetical protein